MKPQKRFHYMLRTVIFLTGLISLLPAETLVDLSQIHPREIQTAGFVIDKDQNVIINSQLNLFYRSRRIAVCYAWILNSETRAVIWESGKFMNRAEKNESNSQSIELKAGTYEVYLSTYHNHKWRNNWHGFHSFFSFIFNDDWDIDYYDNERFYEQVSLKISGGGRALSGKELQADIEKQKQKAFFSLSGLPDEDYQEQLFRIDQLVRLRIYAIGEASRDEPYDFGWIINLDTRERIWQFDYRRTEPAGGAAKNRKYDEVIAVQPGTYKAVFITDDSHSNEEWNSAVPFDPEFWGLTVWAEEAADITKLVRFEKEAENDSAYVSFVRVRDDQYYSGEFALKEKQPVRIYAIGEGSDNEMADFGWIMDVKSHQTIWEMDYRETTPAGGDVKNRLYEGIIALEPGHYRVGYQTDDSHAYHSWNTSPPFDKENYGIRVFLPKEAVKNNLATTFSEKDDAGFLARLVEIGDDERARTTFVMPEDGEISIYAIGEGDHGDMYDYGYIKDLKSGRIVWKMTYDGTRHAGGARKNRLFNDAIFIKAGKYEVIFETDDSHSTDEWNDSPPRDAMNWGITVRLATK
jgi:hypothetical protein